VKLMVVGSGGREHALVWKLSQSPCVDKIYCMPGNAGIEEIAECINIPADDINGLADYAQKHKIDLTVVGPEAPLAAGIVDEFEGRGLKIFGPNKAAAQIESSKVFSKEFMKKYNLPTADFEVFDDPDKAIKYIDEKGFPIVIKAEGLAQGKGVIIAKDRAEAIKAINDMMQEKVFGKAGNRIVIEEYLEGPEVTILSFCDGKHFLPMVSSKDHKKAFDNDKGPNTGGMGAISPSPTYNEELAKKIEKNIIGKTLEAMEIEGMPYKGILYTGLILTEKGPKVLEYNCRFGDPEAQVILPRLNTDLVDIIEACIEGRLDKINVEWKKEKAVCVVAASGGYPKKYKKGMEITGLDQARELGVQIFHAGTLRQEDKIVTSGGRVLGITALGDTQQEAAKKAYDALAKINFEGIQYRKDIGLR
jgi:phosphoribosylamine--glycine ligase